MYGCVCARVGFARELVRICGDVFGACTYLWRVCCMCACVLVCLSVLCLCVCVCVCVCVSCHVYVHACEWGVCVCVRVCDTDVLVHTCTLTHDTHTHTHARCRPQVRDRAAASLRLLTGDDMAPAKMVVGGRLPVGPRALARSLREYQARPGPGEFTFDALPALEEDDDAGMAADESKSSGAGAGAGAGGAGGDAKPGSGAGGYSGELAKVPEFAELGPLFRSTAAVPLTESELEYLTSIFLPVWD